MNSHLTVRHQIPAAGLTQACFHSGFHCISCSHVLLLFSGVQVCTFMFFYEIEHTHTHTYTVQGTVLLCLLPEDNELSIGRLFSEAQEVPTVTGQGRGSYDGMTGGVFTSSFSQPCSVQTLLIPRCDISRSVLITSQQQHPALPPHLLLFSPSLQNFEMSVGMSRVRDSQGIFVPLA